MSTLTIEIPDDLKRQIEENAEQRGLAVSDFVRPALQQLVVDVPNPTAAPDQDDRPIWEVIVDLMKDLPPEVDQPLREVADQRGETPEALATLLLAMLLHDQEHLTPASAQTLSEFVAEHSRLAAIDAGTGALAGTSGTVADFLADRRADVEAEEREEQERWERLQRRRA